LSLFFLVSLAPQRGVGAALRASVWVNPAGTPAPPGAAQPTHVIRSIAGLSDVIDALLEWGARCGCEAPDMREAGRWVPGSADFEEYWRDGVARRAEARASGETDPIYSVWVWDPIVAPT
jgi:hypothetical protein